jgi:acetyl esterase/lipase
MKSPDTIARLNAALKDRYSTDRACVSRVATMAFIALVIAPAGVASQQLVTANDLSDLEWPAPHARIEYGESALQFGYLRLPNGSGPHPVIVFIHGGCWLSAFDIRHAGQAEQALTDAGYAVWSLEYRRVGDEGGGWPGTFLDVANGVDHLAELAREYPLDLDRVIASGHSAGGHLALWAAARQRIPPSSELYSTSPVPIHGVLALAPAPNLAALHGASVCGGVIDGLMGGSPDEHPERYEAASPMQLMPVDVPQRLIVGALDQAWGPSGRAYFEGARIAGESPVTLLEAPESGHFEVILPGSSTWPLVLQELERLSSDVTQPLGAR